MNDHIIFLSTRQLTQLAFDDPSLHGATLSLILCAEERARLPDAMRARFRHVIPVPVSRRDDVLSVYDADAVVEAIRTIRAAGDWVAIVCFDEGNTVTAAYARERLGLAGATPAALRLFRDKVAMKRALEHSGIRTPAYTPLAPHGPEDYPALARTLGVPFVIKPIESAGSNGVHVIDGAADYRAALAQIGPQRDAFEAETFIRGALYHCDLAFVDGRPVFAECTAYLAPTIDFQKGIPLGGRIMPPEHEHRAMLVDFTLRAVRALGGAHGVFHTEVFIDESGRPVFLESGARPPGMLVTRMYELATGINLLNLDVRIQLGRVAAPAPHCAAEEAFYLVYPTRAGTVARVNPAPADPALHIEYRCHAQPGDRHKACTSNLDFTATLVCAGPGDALAHGYRQAAAYQPVSYR